METNTKIKIIRIKQLLDPILLKLEDIDSKISTQKKEPCPMYFRNEDLKKNFGLSNNTIIKYRQTGIIPYTKLGDIFLYKVSEIEKILQNNQG